MTVARDIAVVVPFFQRKVGLLKGALASAFAQTIADRISVIVVVDDASPISAESELAERSGPPCDRISIIARANGGAGAARNTALDALPEGIRYVAFLDSDDRWRPHHLASALHALEQGADVHFADWWSFNFPSHTNFQRIGAPHQDLALALDESGRYFNLGITPLQHVVSEAGGVIQTSTVVYRYDRFPDLRFREEFYNCQDLLFWIDLGERGAHFAFCLDVECDNGEGVNIFQGAGWGSERSLQRLRNEIFLWTSVERFYALPPDLRRRNRKTLRHLHESVIRDVLHRLRRRLPLQAALLADIVSLDPSIVALAPYLPIKVLGERIGQRIFT